MGCVPPSLRMLTICDLAGLAMVRLTLSPLACGIHKGDGGESALLLMRDSLEYQKHAIYFNTRKLSSTSNALHKEKKNNSADFRNPWCTYFQAMDLYSWHHNTCLLWTKSAWQCEQLLQLFRHSEADILQMQFHIRRGLLYQTNGPSSPTSCLA